MSETTEPGADELVGTLESRVTGIGSHSEMTSVVLVPDDDPDAWVVVRRREARALDAEPELLAWVGHRVRVRGSRGFSTFVVDEVVGDPLVDAPESPAGDHGDT